MDVNLRRGCTVERFFDVLEQEAPEVLEDLAGVPWQAYQEWLEGGRAGHRGAGLTWATVACALPDLRRSGQSCWIGPSGGAFSPIGVSIGEPGRFMNGNSARDSASRSAAGRANGSRAKGVTGATERRPPVRGWNPAEESRSDAEKRWSEHLKRQEAVAQKYGWDDIPLKRARSKDPALLGCALALVLRWRDREAEGTPNTHRRLSARSRAAHPRATTGA